MCVYMCVCACVRPYRLQGIIRVMRIRLLPSSLHISHAAQPAAQQRQRAPHKRTVPVLLSDAKTVQNSFPKACWRVTEWGLISLYTCIVPSALWKPK